MSRGWKAPEPERDWRAEEIRAAVDYYDRVPAGAVALAPDGTMYVNRPGGWYEAGADTNAMPLLPWHLVARLWPEVADEVGSV